MVTTSLHVASGGSGHLHSKLVAQGSVRLTRQGLNTLGGRRETLGHGPQTIFLRDEAALVANYILSALLPISCKEPGAHAFGTSTN